MPWRRTDRLRVSENSRWLRLGGRHSRQSVEARLLKESLLIEAEEAPQSGRSGLGLMGIDSCSRNGVPAPPALVCLHP